MSLSPWLATVQAQLAALGHGLAQDKRFRVGLLSGTAVLTLFLLVGSFWSVHRLLRLQMEGPESVTSALWLGMAGVWVGVAGLALVGTLRQGFGTDSARLELSLPLPPATRFRLLVYRSLSEEGGLNLLIATLAFGLVLHRVLGWSGLFWLLPFWAGILLATWLAACLLVIFIRYFLPRLRRLVVPLLLAGTGLEAVGLLFGGEAESVALPTLYFPIGPTTVLLFGLLAIGMGPLARWGGRCYVAAWQVLESRGSGHRARLLPGVGLLTGWLARRRTVAASLLVRSLVNQSRHPLALPRLLVLPVYGLIFPLLYTRLAQGGFSNGQSIALFAGLMGGLLLLEYGIAYPVSAEGARLALFLTAPVGERAFLRGLMGAVLLPILLVSGGYVVGGALWLGLGVGETGWALAAVWMLLAGLVSITAPASAWDAELGVLPMGGAEMLLHEELPTSPRRLLLLGGAFVLLFVGLLLIRLLPGGWLLPVLVVWAVGMRALGEKIGLAGLRALRQKG